MVWYRVRVSESQRHTPTQKYAEYPPPPGGRGGIEPKKTTMKVVWIFSGAKHY